MITMFSKLKAGFVSILFMFLFLLNSCSKDETAEIRGVINGCTESDTTFFDLAFVNLSLDIERGYKFMPLRDGKISQLGVRLQTPGTYTITVYQSSKWSKFSFVCVRNEIKQTTYNQWAYEKIDPFEVKKNMNYYITVVVPANFVFYRSGNLDFPLKNKDVQILSNVIAYNNGEEYYLEGTDESGSAVSYIEGYPDLIFQ